MKNTYLIFKEINGTRQFVVATQAEWDAILKENRGLPTDKRRLFIMDRIVEGDEVDCMYIETTAAEFRKWNNADKESRKKRKIAARYSFTSLDDEVDGTDYDSLHEAIPDDFNLEALVTDQILLEELRTALRDWRPWAEEMLEFYLTGRKRTCNAELAEGNRLTDRGIRKRKMMLEKFILDFLKK